MFDPQHLNYLNQTRGLCFAKDLNSRYVYANPFYAKGVGFNKPENLRGIADAEMPCPMSELAEPFVREDKLVLSNEQPITMLKGLRLLSDKPFSVWLAQKNIIRDKNHTPIGTMGLGFEITENRSLLNSIFLLDEKFFQIKSDFHQFSYTIQERYTNAETVCTKRETECLFYLLRGRTIKETAARVNLAPRTVEKYLEHIKSKMQVNSKSALFEKCISDGMLSILPTGIYEKLGKT